MPLPTICWARFLIPLAILAGSGGCSMYTAFDLSSAERTYLAERNLVSVVARINTDWDGEERGPTFGLNYGGLIAAENWELLGRTWDVNQPTDSGGRFHALPGDTFVAEGGWFRTVVKPGTYVIGLAAKRHGAARESLYQFTVPGDAEAVYIGSLRNRCHGRRNLKGQHALTIHPLMPALTVSMPLECSATFTVTNEGAQAAAALKIPPGTLKTALVRPFGATVSPRFAAIAANWPPRMDVTHDAGLIPPVWHQLNAEVPRGPRERNFAAEFGWELLVRTGLIIPVALGAVIIGGAGAEMAEAEWSPCIKRLSAKLQAAKLEAAFQRRFGARAGKAAPASGDAAPPEDRHRLKTSLERIHLRKCRGAGSFCMEVVMRTQLLSGDGKEVLYDALHRYSNDDGAFPKPFRYAPADRFWEHSLKRQSPCRNIAEYCGENGHRLALREMETAMDAIAEAAVKDLVKHR